MRKTIFIIVSVLLCLTSCVNKQKKFDELTSSIYTNSAATFGITFILCKDYVSATDYEMEQLGNAYIEEGIVDRAVKILSKNDSLYNEAAKLDIDMSKLNDLKNFSDRNKNIWLGFKDKTLNSNTLLDFINYTQNDMQKLETEFKHPNEDEMTKIAKYIYGK